MRLAFCESRILDVSYTGLEKKADPMDLASLGRLLLKSCQ